MIHSICSKCGGELVQNGNDEFKCLFCGAVYREETVKKIEEILSRILDADKREKVAALKQALWIKINEKYTDSEEVVRLCREIKKITPSDFYANFYEAANSERDSDFINALNSIDTVAHYQDMDDILRFALKSITAKNMGAICDLIERAYKQTAPSLYNKYRTMFDAEAIKVNDCVFDPAYPRNVFVCYSSKDMPSVESLVRYLEEQGLLCFVAIRNLKHGSGAVQNYWSAIQTAIENCECVVFLSSKNSRSLNCDALKELRYVVELEQKRGKKIKKIEYLLESYIGVPVERTFKKIFDGLEYCYDKETVFDRILANEPSDSAKERLTHKDTKRVKYCAKCGYENAENVKFCSECDSDEFVATRKEYVELINQTRKELEKRRKEQEELTKIINDTRSRTEREAANATGDNSKRSNGNFDCIKNQNVDDVEVEPIELIKGQHLVLPDKLKRVTVSVENKYSVDNVSANLYVFLLNDNEKVLSESDFVFFGNTKSLNGSVEYKCETSLENVYVNLNKIIRDIERVRFILSFGKEVGRVSNFSMLETCTAKISFNDKVYYLNLESVGRVHSVCLFEFYRMKNKWKLRIMEEGIKEDISKLCINYGIDVED